MRLKTKCKVHLHCFVQRTNKSDISGTLFRTAKNRLLTFSTILLPQLSSLCDEYIYNICHLWSLGTLPERMMFVSSYMTRVISGAGTANLCQCSSRFSMEFELFNLQFSVQCFVNQCSSFFFWPLHCLSSVLFPPTFSETPCIIRVFFCTNYVYYMECHFTKMSTLTYSAFVFSRIMSYYVKACLCFILIVLVMFFFLSSSTLSLVIQILQCISVP